MSKVKLGKLDLTLIGAKYFSERTKFGVNTYALIPLPSIEIDNINGNILLNVSVLEENGTSIVSLPIKDKNNYVVWKQVGMLKNQIEDDSKKLPTEDISADDLEF